MNVLLVLILLSTLKYLFSFPPKSQYVMNKNTVESSTLFIYENTDFHESQNIITHNTLKRLISAIL